MSDRKSNSSECIYEGYKLDCIDTEGLIECSTTGAYAVIGSDGPDKDYRVELTLIKDPEHLEDTDAFYTSVDLEDVIRFAVKNCKGIVDRVIAEEAS